MHLNILVTNFQLAGLSHNTFTYSDRSKQLRTNGYKDIDANMPSHWTCSYSYMCTALHKQLALCTAGDTLSHLAMPTLFPLFFLQTHTLLAPPNMSCTSTTIGRKYIIAHPLLLIKKHQGRGKQELRKYNNYVDRQTDRVHN